MITEKSFPNPVTHWLSFLIFPSHLFSYLFFFLLLTSPPLFPLLFTSLVCLLSDSKQRSRLLLEGCPDVQQASDQDIEADEIVSTSRSNCYDTCMCYHRRSTHHAKCVVCDLCCVMVCEESAACCNACIMWCVVCVVYVVLCCVALHSQ